MKDQKRSLTWIVFLVAILPLIGFWLTGLLDLDEGFYAAVVGEMNRRGEWITPFYNGSPWFEKPILLYWVAKPCVYLFGEMWGPRMPSVLSAIGVYWLVFRVSDRRYGKLAAAYSTLFLSGSLLMIGVSRMMLADGVLGLALVAAMLSFYDSLENIGKNRWQIGIFLGFAVLAKGPVGILLFLIVSGLTFWLIPTLRKGFRGGWMLALVAMLLVIATWYIPVYLANGQVFVQEFLIDQNIGRFTGGDKAHSIPLMQGAFLFLGIMLLGASPWIFKLPSALKLMLPEDHFLKYCAIWGLGIYAFFNLSSAKLPHYILPCLPPLALVVGVMVARKKTIEGANGLTLRLIRGPVIWSTLMCLVANTGFYFWYNGFKFEIGGQHIELAGLHSEVHNLAREARATAIDVAVFQLPRRQKSLGTGSIKIQETSHPSLAFYLGRPYIDCETTGELTKSGKEILVLTRFNRITPEIRKELLNDGFALEIFPTQTKQEFYRLYRLVPL